MKTINVNSFFILEMPSVWHPWPLAKHCWGGFPRRINKFSCHILSASAV